MAAIVDLQPNTLLMISLSPPKCLCFFFVSAVVGWLNQRTCSQENSDIAPILIQTLSCPSFTVISISTISLCCISIISSRCRYEDLPKIPAKQLERNFCQEFL
jgi:hypothetical protein